MTALAAPPRQGELEKLLERGIAELDLELEPGVLGKLLAHLELLEKWNRVHNLTSIRDAAKAVSAHLLDSLVVVPYLPGTRLLDAGTGAGFPGLPVALARPDLQVDLLDSNHKKCAFLRQAVAETGARNAKVVCERVESYHPASLYDCIVSRAFADLAEIVAMSTHLLAPGGVIAAMKGVHPFEEIERIPSNFRVRQVHALSVPGLDAERRLVLIERA